MPLLYIEKRLFVCEWKKKTVQIGVKNAGNDPLKLRKVFPIGECQDNVNVEFSSEAIGPGDWRDITVTIDNYWKPVEIQFNTNCRRTGEIIYILRPPNFQGPNLWLLPDEGYDKYPVFFPYPEPHLRMLMIVQSKRENPLKLDSCSIQLSRDHASENSWTPCEITVYCEKTGRKTNRQRNGQCPQILNFQETYQLHSARIYLPPTYIQEISGEHPIQVKLCTKSHLKALREQEISIKLSKIKSELTARKICCSRLRRTKSAELEIENLGTHPARIFSIATDPDKIEVRYLEKGSEETFVDYPVVIPKKQSRRIRFEIKLSPKEWLWSGTKLCKTSVEIWANATSNNSENSIGLTDKIEIKSARPYWILPLCIIIFTILFFICSLFCQQHHNVFVSSEPQGQRVIVGKKSATTPTWMKLDKNEEIQIGDSDKRRVENVLKNGSIFFSNEQWHTEIKDTK